VCLLFSIPVPSQEGGPVADVEDEEEDGEGDLADQLKLLCLLFLASSKEDRRHNELKNATEDEEHAEKHPDVKI